MSWKYYLPNGGFYTLSDNITREMADDAARKKHPELFTPPESTVGGALVSGFKRLGSEARELAEMPFLGVDEAAERAARRERDILEEYGAGASFEDVGKKYEEEGVLSAAGEVARQSAMAIAGSVPYMAEIGAGAMLGGLPGLAAAAYAPRLASNIQEQATLQREEGKPVDVDVAEAAGYALPMATLDVFAQAIPLGKTAAGKIFGPEVAKLLSMGEKTAAEQAAKDAVLSRKGIWKVMGSGAGKNLIAQEFIQPAEVALGRLQSDQDLLSDDALAAYGEAAYTAAIMSPLGAFEGISERGAARKREAIRAQEKPGIDEESGQMTFAPALFGEEGKVETEEAAPTPEVDADALESTYQALKKQYQEELVRRGDERTLAEEPAVSPDQEDFFRAEVQPIAGEQVRPAREIQLTADEEAGLRADAQAKVTELAEAKPTTIPYSGQLELPGMETPRAGLFGEELYQARFDKEAEAAQREAGEALRAAREETPIEETPVVETPVVETPVVETPIEEAPVTEAPKVEEAPVSRAAEVTGLGDKYTALVDTIHLKLDPVKQWVTPSFVATELNIDIPQAREVMKNLADDGYITNPNKSGWYRVTDKVAAEAKPIPRARMIGGARTAEEPIRRAPMMGGRNIAVEEQRRAPMMGGRNAIAEPETGRARMMGGRNLLAEETVETTVEPTVETPRRARMLGGRNLLAEETENAPVIETDTERAAGSVAGERLDERGVPGSTRQPIQSRGAGEPSIETAGSERLVTDKPSITEPTERTGERPAALDAAELNRQKTQQSEAAKRSQIANDLQVRLDEISDNLHPRVTDRIQSAIEQVKRGVRTPAEVEHLFKNAEEKVAGIEEAPKVEAPTTKTPAIETPAPSAPPVDRIALIKAAQEKIGGKKTQEPRTQLGETTGSGTHVSTAQAVVNAIISKWKNAPKVNVVQSIADLPEHLQNVDPRAKGLYDPSTQTVHIIADNAHAANPHESIKATLFHESLGHFGLEQAYGTGLDALLTNLYKTNKTVRERTDAWLKRNPDAYKDSPDRIARAVEEMFSDMSERGEAKVPTGIHLALTKVADYIRGFLERMGLKQKDYGKAEMREIMDTLQRAHESVTGGKGGVAERANKGEVRYQRAPFVDEIPDNVVSNLRRVTTVPNPNQAEGSSKYQKMLTDVLDRHGDKPGVATIVNALSRMPTDALNVWNKSQTQFGIERAYQHLAAELPKLTDHIAMMSANKYSDLIDAEKTTINMRDTIYNAVKQYGRNAQVGFNKLVDDLTITQADIWDLDAKTHTFTEKKEVADLLDAVRAGRVKVEGMDAATKQLYTVASQYYALPKEVRDTARQYFGYFNKLSDRGVEAVKRLAIDNIKDKELVKKIQGRHAIGELKYYAPRTRQGNYVLKFTGRDGGRYVTQHASFAARALARKRLVAEGATEFSEEVRNPRSPADKLAPTGLLGEVLNNVKQKYMLTPEQMEKMSDADLEAHNKKFASVTNAIYDGFLEFMPNRVIKDARGRAIIELADGTKQYGYKGAEHDALKVFTDEVPGIVYQINKVRWSTKLDDSYTKIREQMRTKLSEGKSTLNEAQTNAVLNDLAKRIEFAKNPTYNQLVNWNSKTNYYWSIAGNVSSGLTNTTVLPMFVAPNLAGKYGTAKTTKAMSLATRLYPAFREFDKHDLVDGEHSAQHKAEFLKALQSVDLSEFGVTGEDIAKLHKYLLDRSATGNSALHELRQTQISKSGYEKLSDKANYIVGAAMRESEQFNRGITHLSAFLLDMDNRRGQTDALERASREAYLFNGEMNGSAAPETNSSLYQSNWGRVLLTFRSFPINMAIQTAKVFKRAVAEVAENDAEAKQLRTVARRQMLGIMGMTYAFAGIKGLPLYGLTNVLASFLYDDKDEPFDLDQEITDSWLGTVGLNGIMNQVLGVDVANRVGFNGILWRDDPKRLAEVGYVDYIAERAFGPTVGILQGFGRAHDAMQQGHYERAIEYAVPASLRNILKGARYLSEGAKTLSGQPIKDDVGLWNAANQVIGFTPTDISERMTETTALNAVDKKLQDRKSILLTKLNAARTAGDAEEMQEVMGEIDEFRSKNPGVFKQNTIQASFKQHDAIARQTVNGLYLPKARLEAARRYVADTTDEE